MKRRLCILSGLVLLSLALSLHAANESEITRAAHSADHILVQLKQQRPATAEPQPSDAPVQEALIIDGYPCIGTLSIPRLELELPILSQWDEEQLKIAPCRFSGSVSTGDLVLMAHNYRTHFGPIRRLKPGDAVSFTDPGGVTTRYLVAATATVEPADPEAVTSGRYPLTLFTCTYGARTRVVVYCDAATPDI